MAEEGDTPLGSGSGSSLPLPVLVVSGICTVFAVLVSGMSIFLHLKNYRKPLLQRWVALIRVTELNSLLIIQIQDGYKNHAHGTYIRYIVPYIVVFIERSFRDRCYSGYLRSSLPIFVPMTLNISLHICLRPLSFIVSSIFYLDI